VAKAEIRAWPVLGWLVEKAGTVFIARGNRRELRHIFKGLVDALAQQGQRVAFFPEGTTPLQGSCCPSTPTCSRRRSTPGCRCSRMRWPTSTRAAAGTGGRLYGRSDVCRQHPAHPGGEPVVARLACLAPIGAGKGAHRRELAQAAHEAIQARR
jgi:1-acyl-sn-glycerol-3-phosphate acyltransferase